MHSAVVGVGASGSSGVRVADQPAGLGVPHAYLADAGGDDAVAVGTVRQAGQIVAVFAGDVHHDAPGIRVPHAHALTAAKACRQALAVRAEGDCGQVREKAAVIKGEAAHDSAGLDVPQPHRPVAPTAGETGAIRADGDAPAVPAAPRKDRHGVRRAGRLLVRRRVPDLHGVVLTEGDDLPAVRAKQQGADGRMAAEDADFAAGLHVPEAHDTVAGRGAGKPRPVRAERDARDICGVASEGRAFLARFDVPQHDVVFGPGARRFAVRADGDAVVLAAVLDRFAPVRARLRVPKESVPAAAPPQPRAVGAENKSSQRKKLRTCDGRGDPLAGLGVQDQHGLGLLVTKVHRGVGPRGRAPWV